MLALALAAPAAASASAPSAVTFSVLSTGATTATLAGIVNPEGATTTYHAAYSLASATWCTTKGVSGSIEHATVPQPLGSTKAGYDFVEVEMTGLTAGQKYCVELVAENASGPGYGEQVALTAGAPSA
jgi:hypothetical protein